MRRTLRALIAVGALSVGLGAPGAGGEPFAQGQLLTLGNSAYPSNCVTGSKYYYAILQQFPGWPNAQSVARMRQRINTCEQRAIDFAGIDFKGDEGASGPRRRACVAYAEIAMAQVRAQRSAGGCGAGGDAWANNIQAHFDWCMNHATPNEVRSETFERNMVLNRCVFHNAW